MGAKTISTPTFSTSATVKIQIKDGKIKLDGTLTMAAGAAGGMSADFCAAFLGRRRRLQELEAPGAEEPSADEGHRRELLIGGLPTPTIPTIPCNIPTLTIAVPAFSASLTGTVEVDAAGLAAGYEIELCTVFPTLTSQTFCLGGGYNGVPSTVAGASATRGSNPVAPPIRPRGSLNLPSRLLLRGAPPLPPRPPYLIVPPRPSTGRRHHERLHGTEHLQEALGRRAVQPP